jgi:hypothetical protein
MRVGLQRPAVSAWLSDDMAQALAAMSPPLVKADVLAAADKLMADTGTAPVIDDLLRQGGDLMTVRQVVEALRALRDARVTDSGLAGWLIAREAGLAGGSFGSALVEERVLEKLGTGLARLASPGGTQALLSRALHVARPQFPVLEGVRARVAPDVGFTGLGGAVPKLDRAELGKGLQAVLGVLLDLIVGLVGEDLTMRLVSAVWPDQFEPDRAGYPAEG